jgi:hypothetical protein
MGKKIALNVVYNLGIFVALMIGYWGVEHAQYAYLLGAVFIAGCIYLPENKADKGSKKHYREAVTHRLPMLEFKCPVCVTKPGI